MTKHQQDLTQAVEATKAIAALLDCEMRGTPLTPDQARAIAWMLQQQSKVIENQGREIDALTERLEEERRYTDEEFAAMKDDETTALARLLLSVPGPDKNVAALVAWVTDQGRKIKRLREALYYVTGEYHVARKHPGTVETCPDKRCEATVAALNPESTPS